MTPVTKPYLPSREKLSKYIDGIYEREWLTNNGPLVQELTSRLENYLGVENLLLVSNGTLALQIAYRTLGVSEPIEHQRPEAITTPFTFVATASSLKWEGIEPIFVDIDPLTWCLDPKNITSAITSTTKAIVPVHVFGNACEVEKIDAIAKKYNLKVIYDAAHAFGVRYKGESLLKWGDAATLSFHATKIFHTLEGGAIVFKRKDDLERAKRLISFGIIRPDVIGELGINAKMNEFQAAMGLCVLDDIEEQLIARKKKWNVYKSALENKFQTQEFATNLDYNYSYFPLTLKSEGKLADFLRSCSKYNVKPRRYFYPSLCTIPFFNSTRCTESLLLARRIVCLPLFPSIEESKQLMIADLLVSME